MARILFIPSALNEVPTIASVASELEPNLKASLLALPLDQKMEAHLKKHCFTYKRFTEYRAKNARDILKKEKAGLVLTNNWDDIPRAFAYAAADMGIPALSVDDGVSFSTPTRYGGLWYSPGRLAPRRILRWLKDRQRLNRWRDLLFVFRTLRAAWGFVPALASLWGEIDRRFPRPTIKHLKYAVAGQSAKDAYVQRGVTPDNVYITGQPRFDVLLRREFNREQLVSELAIPSDKGIIILATQPLAGGFWTERQQREFTETVVRAMPSFPEHQWVIKPHPQEDEKYYRRILTELGETRAVVRQKVDIYELLHASELLITAYSTVALEAMLLDKPVITINLTDKPDPMPYARSGAAIGVYKKEDLIPATKNALFDTQTREKLANQRRAFLLEHAHIADGQASRRVAEIIARLIREPRNE